MVVLCQVIFKMTLKVAIIATQQKMAIISSSLKQFGPGLEKKLLEAIRKMAMYICTVLAHISVKQA